MHRLWMHGTACIFDVHITDSDVARNRGERTYRVLENN